MTAWGRVVGIGAVVTLIAVGCSQRQESSSTETMTESQNATTVDTAAVPGGGTTAPSWLATAHEHEAALQSAIENGRLNEVHNHAEALQATFKDGGQQAAGLSAEQRTQLDAHLSETRKLAGTMHDASDAGDLTRTKAEFARLRTSLRAIESLLGVSAP